jgi:hypothetical protein
MKSQPVQFCLRMPKESYEQAVEVARVFDLSLNQFFLRAIRCYVESQLKEDVIQSAVTKTREARRAGLVNGVGAGAKSATD